MLKVKKSENIRKCYKISIRLISISVIKIDFYKKIQLEHIFDMKQEKNRASGDPTRG